MALTGGLASGKSTAARVLGARGVPVLDCDAEVAALYRPGQPGALRVGELFGPSALTPEGAVDRAALADRILGDSDARRLLEAEIHPLVRTRVREWLARQEPGRPAVVEAALMVETGSWREHDVLLVAWCRADQQLERAVARGMPRERAEGLLAAQLPVDEKRDRADVVVDTSGEIDELPVEVDRAWQDVLRLCAERLGRRSRGTTSSTDSVRI